MCRNKTYEHANDKVPWSWLQCLAFLAVTSVSHKQKSTAVALLWVKCIRITPTGEWRRKYEFINVRFGRILVP